MRKQLKFKVLTFILFSLFACKSESEKKNIQPSDSDNNIFVVDKNFCKEMGLPIIEFSVEYPKVLKTDPAEKGYENYNYNAFFKWNDDEIQTEGISFGFLINQGSTPNDIFSKQLLNQILEHYQDMFEMSEVKIEKEIFDNQEYWILRAKGAVNNPEEGDEFVGNYIIQTLMLEPQKNNKNGLLVTFMANEDSDIKSFEDFAKKGYISTVWNTLKFH